MLSYLPCGLGAERSYIQRKAQLVFSHLFVHDFFLHKIIKANKFYKIYLLQKILSKTFSWN